MAVAAGNEYHSFSDQLSGWDVEG